MADRVSIHMAASLLGQYGGGRCGRRVLGGRSGGGCYERVHARSGGGARRSAASLKRLMSVKQLVSRLLRRSCRRRAARPRQSAVTFGYDLHSYYQNFDDGIASFGHHHRLASVRY